METSVLIIQEDIILRKILERLVLSLRFSCEALPSLYDLDLTEQKGDFDVVVTDILFDGMSPLDFAVQIQEAIRLKHLLIVTNMGQENIKREILGIKGVDGFFGVPFDLEEIEHRLLLL